MNPETKIELNLLFKEILTTPINSQNASLYVILNGIRYKNDSSKTQFETKTLFFDIVKDMDGSFNKIGKKFKVIDSALLGTNQPATATIQLPGKLTPILQNISVSAEEEVVLVTWDHGSAFGIFRDTEPPQPSIEPRKPVYDELEKFPYLKEFWEHALKNDKQFDEFITNQKKKRFEPILQSAYRFYVLFDNDANKNRFKELLMNENLTGLLKIHKIESQSPRLVFDPAGRGSQNLFFGKEEIPQQIAEGVEIQEAVPEILSNHELALSISVWLNKDAWLNKEDEDEDLSDNLLTQKKVGVLLMMNCWMMNLHTLYSLQYSVECLVAPVGDIAIPGYNYRDMLKYIYDPKTFCRSNQKLAKKIVQTCENKFALKRAENIYKQLKNKKHAKIDAWKIVAVDLTTKDTDGTSLFQNQITALKKMIEMLNSFITPISGINPFPEMKSLCKYVRSVCFDFSDKESKMIDIINWLLSIKSANETFVGGSTKLPGDILVAIPEFCALIIRKKGEKNLVLKMSTGKLVYPENSDPLNSSIILKLPPTGYNLFFPAFDFSKDLKLKSNIANDLFLNKFLSSWKTFLTTAIDKDIIF